jgi:hypothetical protein
MYTKRARREKTDNIFNEKIKKSRTGGGVVKNSLCAKCTKNTLKNRKCFSLKLFIFLPKLLQFANI